MLFTKKAACIAALGLGIVAVSVAPVHAQNLLTNNPGFESGTLAGWTAVGGYSGASSSFIAGQEGTTYAFLGQGAVLETVAGSRPTVGAPGALTFSLTFQAQNDGATNPGSAAIVFYNAAGTQVSAVTTPFTANGNLGSFYSVTGAVAPVGAVSVAARLSTSNAPVSQFRVDNFVLTSTVVPEASTLTLAIGALGAVAVVIRRRKA